PRCARSASCAVMSNSTTEHEAAHGRRPKRLAAHSSGYLLRPDWQESDIHGHARALSHEFDWHVRARLGADDHASDIWGMRHRLFADPHDDVAGCDPGAIGRPIRLYRHHERTLAALRRRRRHAEPRAIHTTLRP